MWICQSQRRIFIMVWRKKKKTRREKVLRRKFSFFASAKPTLFSYYIFIGSRVTAPQRNIKPGQIKFGQSLVFFFLLWNVESSAAASLSLVRGRGQLCPAAELPRADERDHGPEHDAVPPHHGSRGNLG